MMDKVQLERNRYHLLMHLIKSNRQGKAWEFFNQLRSNMLARTHHYAKILPLCDDVRYTMHLINEIRNNTHIVGDINLNCYRALVNQLLFECYTYDEIIKIVKDQQEIDGQYRRSGFDPKRFDKQVFKNLKYFTHSEKGIAVVNTKRNRKLFSICSRLDASKALQYFQLLYKNKKLDKYNLTTIMASFCSADLCSELLDQLKYYEEIIETDSHFYIPYVRSLVYEGRNEEAREFVYSKLPKLGVKPDTSLTTYFEISQHFLHLRRREMLTNLRSAGRESDAALVYEVMLDSGIKPINFEGNTAYSAMWNEFKHEREVDNGVPHRNLNVLERGEGNKRNKSRGLVHKILDKFELEKFFS